MKSILTKQTSSSLNPGIYEKSNINTTLKNYLPDIVTIVDIRLKFKLKNIQTLVFTKKKYFFFEISGFTCSRSNPLDDIDGFYQMIAGSYKKDRPINITGIRKTQLKCDCINGSVVNGTREPFLDSFACDQPPGRKIYKEPGVNFFKN